MAIQRTPSPPQKKSSKAGLGCLGCGCLLVIVIFLVGAGLVGGLTYMCYKELYIVSSPAAETIAPYTGSEDIYTGAQKKLAAFNQDVTSGKTSTLTLSADEINSLIQHTVDLKKVQGQALVSLTGEEARVQGSIPSNDVPVVNLGVKDRYFNLDATTGISLNPDTHEIAFEFHKMQIGDVVVPQNSLASFQATFSQQINMKLRQNTAVWNVLQVAKSVSIKDGQFVIETK